MLLHGDWGLGPIPNPQSPFTLINTYTFLRNLKLIYFLIKINIKMETESKSKEEEEPKELSECWDWASAIAEG